MAGFGGIVKRQGYTLLEVLIASIILMVGLVPLVSGMFGRASDHWKPRLRATNRCEGRLSNLLEPGSDHEQRRKALGSFPRCDQPEESR